MLVGDVVSARHELHCLPSPLPFHGAVQRDLHPTRQTFNPQLNPLVEQADLGADLEEVGGRVGTGFWEEGGRGRGSVTGGKLRCAWVQERANLAQTPQRC